MDGWELLVAGEFELEMEEQSSENSTLPGSPDRVSSTMDADSSVSPTVLSFEISESSPELQVIGENIVLDADIVQMPPKMLNPVEEIEKMMAEERDVATFSELNFSSNSLEID